MGKSGSYWLAWCGGKCVSEIVTDAMMWLTTLNITLLNTPNTSRRCTVNPTHIHTWTKLLGGFGLGTEAPQGLVVTKNHFEFICSPFTLAATCRQESAFGCTNTITDHRECSTCTLHTQMGKSATLLQQAVNYILSKRWLCKLDLFSLMHFSNAFTHIQIFILVQLDLKETVIYGNVLVYHLPSV